MSSGDPAFEVSGGGDFAVTTEALLGARHALARLKERSHEVLDHVERALSFLDQATAGAAWSLRRAERELDAASYETERLSDELFRAPEEYGWVERVVLAQGQLLARVLGPVFAVPEFALAFAVGAAQHGAVGFGDPVLLGALRTLADSLSLPVLVDLVRAVPGPMLEETGVTAHQPAGASETPAAPAPGGFADLARRVPSAGPGLPQVRVERYELPDGETHWIVYSAGTIDWGVVAGAEPWDDTSNLVGVAGATAGSTRATLAALAQEGWRPGEAVLPVGHSQGGIVATGITTSGVAPVPMLVTFGSPTAGAPVPKGVTDVAVEHTDDVVPVLGGSPRPLRQDTRLLVREAGPDAGAGPSVASAHAMSGYLATAGRMDASSDRRLVAARAQLHAFTGGRPAEVTLWRGERVDRAVRGGPSPRTAPGLSPGRGG